MNESGRNSSLDRGRPRAGAPNAQGLAFPADGVKGGLLVVRRFKPEFPDRAKEYGFLFSGRVFSLVLNRLPAVNPRNLQPEPLAQVDGCGVRRQTIDVGPQVQCVPLGAALEALVGMLGDVDGERSARGALGTMRGAGAATLVARRFRWNEAQQVKHVLHSGRGSDSLKVDARHVEGPCSKEFATRSSTWRQREKRGPEKRNPYSVQRWCGSAPTSVLRRQASPSKIARPK